MRAYQRLKKYTGKKIFIKKTWFVRHFLLCCSKCAVMWPLMGQTWRKSDRCSASKKVYRQGKVRENNLTKFLQKSIATYCPGV
jgi:hypothetical protein